MTTIRETIARTYVETIIGRPDTEWAAHWQWYLDGAGNPDSCVHYSNHGRGAQHADAVLRALDEAGLRVVPVEPSEAMVSAITGDAWDAVYEMGRTSERISGGAAHITEADARRLARAVIRAASVVE